ncbi:3-oxoacyl-ACP synthase [Flavobacterium muglaense]|uniref:3-oxoacyl-ACP synthase n=1 Tax=Flavobacterium muglaense TaxID=2764716 RepID=A0A923MY57_9FLAO|nr:3-oxoacyl-ACP synthase [Flavobacterium muglaense]MBC5837347.1 3-oxoacyl-ACP synthase [Flavobacterium muglaense]MBC5843921.1 3-oxoacyl-ACP synthase [Flavobacterium muglaense]
MANKTYIQSFCTIEENQIKVNGKILFEKEQSLFSDFSKSVYQHFNIDYPKFFKMDNLSKLAFLATELLLEKTENEEQENNTALVFSNKSSSLDTDTKYQSSITDKGSYYPSPAVFVYTLPNICLGEISIRHQLKSENSFFVFAQFNPLFMMNYANILLEKNKATSVLCGWVEYFDEEYKTLLYLVGAEGELEHSEESIKKLYK